MVGLSLLILRLSSLILLSSTIVGAYSSCEKYHSFEHPQINPTTNQPYRTGYHFQPPKNWLNDPNGPMHYRGVYHLFYQYNPSGPLFGDIMIWAHSVSYDLINWVSLEHALCPSESFDIKSCWSGSATILPEPDSNVCPSDSIDVNGCRPVDNPIILYTGIDSTGRQVQNLAEPANRSDPLLRQWTKSRRNPIMNPPEGVGPTDFRDPSTAWRGQDGAWRVVIGGLVNGTIGAGLLYRTYDFVNWVRLKEPLYQSTAIGMWECPDFFPVSLNGTNGVDTSVSYPNSNVKHVLKAGSFRDLHDYYIVGKYDAETETFVPESHFTGTSSDLRYDYGKFYASKSFFDGAKNRRILWGWVNESDSAEDDVAKGWSGLQAVPRKLWLDRGGRRLMQWPIEEINSLRDTQVSLHGKKLSGGELIEVSGITASQADVEVLFELSDVEDAEVMNPTWDDPQQICSDKNLLKATNNRVGPFGLSVLASKDLMEETTIYFRVFRSSDGFKVLMCSDQSRSSVKDRLDKATYGAFVEIDPLKEKISLRCLIDHSIVESYGGEGRSVITARVYPKLAVNENAHLFAFNNGTKSVRVSSLNAWTMKQAHINSKTAIEQW